MKKLMLIAVLTFTAFTMKASVSDIFSVDQTKINAETADLTSLETYVEMNQGVTLSEVQATNGLLTANILTSEESPLSQSSVLRRRGGDTPLGIPSLVWGLCFSVTGVALVYFIADDKDETMKAFWGCVIGGAVYGLFYVIYVVAFVTTVNNNIP